jgi:hypothetical protein
VAGQLTASRSTTPSGCAIPVIDERLMDYDCGREQGIARFAARANELRGHFVEADVRATFRSGAPGTRPSGPTTAWPIW